MRRRTVLTGGASVALSYLVGSNALKHEARAAGRAGRAASPPSGAEVAGWKLWVLRTPSQFRPASPGSAASELPTVQRMVGTVDAAALQAIRYWDAGAPAYRWNQLALQRLNPLTAPAETRGMALLQVALYDATVAAWDAKYAVNRSRPSAADPGLTPLVATPSSPSYPSEHAVVAGAAATILSYLFPDDAHLFADKANEAGGSRVLAGVQYPSDVAAGLDLGRRVAALVIDRAQTDGSNTSFTGTVPTGPGTWIPAPGTSGVAPVAGTWQTWVLASGSQFRPDAPPAYDSDQEQAELGEVLTFAHTYDTDFAVFRWSPPNMQTAGDQLAQALFEAHLDADPPRAARASALLTVAAYDAMVACWDAKYAYWAIRPYQLDPTVKTLLPHYNHPTYPSAHASVAGATATVLGYLFPADADRFAQQAQELANSRVTAGIHFRTDTEIGLTLGRSVGMAVVQWAQQDGSS